jgi:hypothetical protein
LPQFVCAVRIGGRFARMYRESNGRHDPEQYRGEGKKLVPA